MRQGYSSQLYPQPEAAATEKNAKGRRARARIKIPQRINSATGILFPRHTIMAHEYIYMRARRWAIRTILPLVAMTEGSIDIVCGSRLLHQTSRAHIMRVSWALALHLSLSRGYISGGVAHYDKVNVLGVVDAVIGETGPVGNERCIVMPKYHVLTGIYLAFLIAIIVLE